MVWCGLAMVVCFMCGWWLKLLMWWLFLMSDDVDVVLNEILQAVMVLLFNVVKRMTVMGLMW